jgi:hypothetical protein
MQNLSEEVDVEMLFDFFSQFGEIYQCKTDTDLYDQYFGQVRVAGTAFGQLRVSMLLLLHHCLCVSTFGPIV